MEQPEAGWTNEAWTAETRGKMAVFFHTVQEPNEFKSRQAGRPIFDEKVYIKKLVPGDQYLTIDREVRESDKDQFPQQWARWLQTRENVVSGTPIALWPELTETQKAEFAAIKIQTIDQFANLPDSMGARIMGFNELREKARAFIAASSSTASSLQQIDAMQSIINQQKEQMEALQAQMRELMRSNAAPAARRGRPRKEQPTEVMAA